MGNDIGHIRVNVELDSMRASLMHAFSEKLGDIGHQLQEAIDTACSAEAVQKVLYEASSRYLREAIEAAARDFLLYGAGNQIVKTLVRDRLSSELAEFRKDQPEESQGA